MEIRKVEVPSSKHAELAAFDVGKLGESVSGEGPGGGGAD